METAPATLRSMLFVPANKTNWATKGIQCGADALIFDLEDAVAANDKRAARAELEAYLQDLSDPQVHIFVRVNAVQTREVLDDLEAVVGPKVTGVLIPKVESRNDVVIVSQLLSWIERDRDMRVGQTYVVPVLETAAGIRRAFDVASSSPRIAYLGGLGVKGGDVERSIGYRWSPEGLETLTLRSNVLLDARAAGVANPVTGLWSDVVDLVGLEKFANQSRALGYEGMLAIHPSHISIINEVFTPSATELDRDADLVAAMNLAAALGDGATTFEGQMVDEAMAVTARERLSKYR